MVQFSQNIGLPIQFVYYPPYHSKYNAIERVWAALEHYWNPLILDTIENTIAIAKRMTWNGFNPIVHFLDKVYETGVEVTAKELKKVEQFITRNPDLKKWDFIINT